MRAGGKGGSAILEAVLMGLDYEKGYDVVGWSQSAHLR